MISLLQIIYSTLKEDFNFFYYLIIVSFTFLGIWINYHVVDIELTIWKQDKTYEWLSFIFFYTIVYLFCLLVGELCKKGDFSWLNKEFFFKIVFIFSILASVRSLVGAVVNSHLQSLKIAQPLEVFMRFNLWATGSFLFSLVVLYIFYKVYDSRKYNFNNNFYGFLLPKKKQLKIYIFMAFFVIPLVVISLLTQETMKKYYPLFENRIYSLEKYNLPNWLSILIFELNYAIAFVRVELIFRGFLILSLVKIIGARAVLPMAVVYCFAHFGKPIAECVSSLFGGFLLGAVTLKHKSIVFGIALHIFLALSLEFFATIIR